MTTPHLIATPEAAFIAGLSGRQMHRVTDEQLIPAGLWVTQQGNRLYTRLGAAFACFYFGAEDVLTASARRQILEELVMRMDGLAEKSRILDLQSLDAMDWSIERLGVMVDMTTHLEEASSRIQSIAWAESLVVSCPDILGGMPVFAGTRLPIEVLLGSLEEGMDMWQVVEVYPFITEAHVQCAKIFDKVHPRRGRPRRLADMNPQIQHKVLQTIRPGSKT